MAIVGLLVPVAAFMLVAPILTGNHQRVELFKKKSLLLGAQHSADGSQPCR
jgi:hypothetical protein